MNGISAIVISKNEEKNISDCMKTLDFADEILLIDSGSTDKTLDIAKKYNVRIIRTDVSDFSKLRIIGKENAKYDWLLYVDSDERVSGKLSDEISEKIGNTVYSSFKIIRQNYFFHKKWPKKEEMVRLIKKDALISWEGVIHETPKITGKTGNMEEELLHFTHNDLTSMVNKTNKWSDVESSLRYKAKHPKMTWWRFIRVMITAFYKSYVLDYGWKAGTIGLIESIYQSFSIFITYAKLWEKQNDKK